MAKTTDGYEHPITFTREAQPFVLPPRVQIGPFWYAIVRTPGLSEKNAWGRHDGDGRLLEFSSECNSVQLSVTFIHELIHDVGAQYGVSLKERDTDALANGLAQALQSAGLLPERLVLEGEDA